MARKSWLENLLRRVSNSSAPASRKRPGTRLRALEILEDRLAPAAATLVGSGAASARMAKAPAMVTACGYKCCFDEFHDFLHRG